MLHSSGSTARVGRSAAGQWRVRRRGSRSDVGSARSRGASPAARGSVNAAWTVAGIQTQNDYVQALHNDPLTGGGTPERLRLSPHEAVTATLVLLRHGESEWNAKNLFTGWVDVDLSEKGERRGARAAASCCGTPACCPTCCTPRCCGGRSAPPRSRSTRPTGTGSRCAGPGGSTSGTTARCRARTRQQTLAEYGEEQFMLWRRSYDTPPPPLDDDDECVAGRRPAVRRAAAGDRARAPSASRTCVDRMLPYWYDAIVPDLRPGQVVLVAAHGNSLRALVKHLDGIVRRGRRRAEHPDRHPAALRARRATCARSPPAASTSTRRPPPRRSRPSRTRAAMANYGDWQFSIYLNGLTGRSRRTCRWPTPISSGGPRGALAGDLVLRGRRRRRRAHPARQRRGVRPVGPDAADAGRRRRARPVDRAVRHALPTPLLMAPVGVIGTVRPRTATATSRRPGGGATGVPMIASTLMQDPMEDVAAALGDTPGFFQLYTPNDRDLAESFVHRAEAAGLRGHRRHARHLTLGWRPRDLTLAQLPAAARPVPGQLLHRPGLPGQARRAAGGGPAAATGAVGARLFGDPS